MQAEGRGAKFVTTLAQRSNNNNGNRREGVGCTPSKYKIETYEIRNTAGSGQNCVPLGQISPHFRV